MIYVGRTHGHPSCLFFFFFNDTATTEIYTLSLHDALPISASSRCSAPAAWRRRRPSRCSSTSPDRKSTRLNSSHSQISYAVFCLKKKNIGNSFSSRSRNQACYPLSTNETTVFPVSACE